ncbi:MAG TPA: DMT family transporter [Bauldia sp.]|nr:DMT family transporter [Bauldia sp.]
MLPFAALFLGAMAMAMSPIFVRFADVGPFASAFWRVAGALPLLAIWAVAEARRRGEPASAAFRLDRATLMAGLVFAADLLFWHLSILNTTVANATFLATMAPVWVVLGSGLFIGEAVDRKVVYGLVLCVAGAAALVGTSIGFAPGRLAGDLYGIATSVFFGAYFLAVRAARRGSGVARIVFLSSLISAIVLLPVAMVFEGRILPHSAGGAAAVAALALVSHVAGQGFLTYALGHLPAAFSALVIFIEALAAAVAAWLLLGEPVSALQAAGGALILAGIAAARPRRTPS